MIEYRRDQRRERQTRSQVAARIRRKEQDEGYRAYRGKFDDQPPLRGRNPKELRKARNERYSMFRELSGRAVRSFNAPQQNPSNRQGNKKMRDRLSTGMCEICGIALTEPLDGHRQRWHMETLEHLLDFDLGGRTRMGEVSVLCRACNFTLGHMKMNLHRQTQDVSPARKSEMVYDLFIFKHVLHLSRIAAARDFNSEYLEFWNIRRKNANQCHRKALRTHPQRLVESIQPTVYWTNSEQRFPDCLMGHHHHCNECGACYTNSSTHHNGHNLPYLRDIDND